MPIRAIDGRRLYEKVVEQLGDLMRSGEFLPGRRLPAERDLAKTLGVGRSAVREAMIALEIAGLVEARTGSGTFVRERRAAPPRRANGGHSPSDILNARMLIEGEIAARAAANASPDDLATMAGLIAQMTDEHEAGRPWGGADLAFHLAIASACGNATLASVVELLWREQYAALSIPSQRALLQGNWPATLRGHQAILEAIRSREPGAARDRMHDHLRHVLDPLLGDAAAEPAASRPNSGA